jgi:hypothetical protein
MMQPQQLIITKWMLHVHLEPANPEHRIVLRCVEGHHSANAGPVRSRRMVQ